VAVDNSSTHAVFDGLAVAGDRLYAADFHNASRCVLLVQPAAALLLRPEDAEGMGRRSESGPEWEHLRDREAGRKGDDAGRARDRTTSTSSPGWEARSPRGSRIPRAPLNAPWGSRWRLRTSASAATCSSATSERAHQRLRPQSSRKWVYRSRSGQLAGRRSSRQALGDRVQPAGATRYDERPLLRRGAAGGRTVSSASSPSASRRRAPGAGQPARRVSRARPLMLRSNSPLNERDLLYG
jgi:hypothetical protein